MTHTIKYPSFQTLKYYPQKRLLHYVVIAAVMANFATTTTITTKGGEA